MKKKERKLLKFTLLTLVLIISIMFGSMLTVGAEGNCYDGTCNHGAVVTVYQTADLRDNMFSSCKKVRNIILSEGVTEIPLQFASGARNLEEVSIPSTVTVIGGRAFEYCNLRSVIIPEGVTIMGSAAFQYCANLTDVYIPSTLTFSYSYLPYDGKPFSHTNLKNVTIGSQAHAFSELTLTPETIETVTLTEHITDVAELELEDCTNLQAVYVNENNPYYSSEDGVLFNKNKTEIIFYPPEKTDTKYKIPDSVETIRSGCFKNSSLKEMELPASLKLVESRAFDGTPLERISKIPRTVESLKMSAFSNHNMTDVYFDGTEAEWKKIISVYIDYGDGSGYYDLEPFYPEVTVHFNSVVPDEPDDSDESEEPENPFGIIIDTDVYTVEVKGVTSDRIFAILDSNLQYDKVLSWDITLTVNGVEVQPDGKVTVRIPVPDGYDPDKCKVYHIDPATGKLTDMAAYYENGYFVFTTDHFSVYSVVELHEHSYGDKDATCDCGFDRTDNCSCNCHKSGFMGIIWKILRFFYKLFKANPVCACGVAHY